MEKIQKEVKRYGGGSRQGKASKSGKGGGGQSGTSHSGPLANRLTTGNTLMKIYVDKDSEGRATMSKDQVVDLI